MSSRGFICGLNGKDNVAAIFGRRFCEEFLDRKILGQKNGEYAKSTMGSL